MKTLSPQLLAFLERQSSYNRADLFQISLLNGQNINATTASTPIDFGFPLTRYYPSLYGAWERGTVKSEVSFTPKSSDMELTVIADNSVLFPVGTASALSVPLMQAIRQGLFDAATVRVFTVYWAIGEPPDQTLKMGSPPTFFTGLIGSLITFVGQIASVEQTGRSKAKFRVADMLYLLNHTTPPNIIQSGCRYQLFDHGCTLNKASFTMNNSVAAGSNSVYINLGSALSTASFTNAFMTFSQGEVLFTSGANQGLRYYIKNQVSDTQIQLGSPLKFPITNGDTMKLTPGCDKTTNKCLNQYNNLIHIGAMPFVPNPETAL